LKDFFIQTNGIRLHAIQAGPEDGPPVVLLHGFPEFWRSWLKQIQPLAGAGFRLIIPDQRGYNLSDAPEGIQAYRMEELERDIIGMLDALEFKDCCLAGHDWGAAVAWSIAMTYPQRVRKLAILNVPHPAVMLEYLRTRPNQMLKSWYIGLFQIPGLAEWLIKRNDYALSVRALRGSSRPGTFSDEDIAEYKQAWRNSGRMSGMINWYRALVRNKPPAVPKDTRLHMPVRILWGKRDAFLSHEMAQASAALCDQVELTLFEDATHWVQHEEAQAVSQALINFFNPRADRLDANQQPG
jgi:pimeloyl-ACP methyl ester carboxylesterase